MGISFSRLFSNYKIAILHKFSASMVRMAIYVVLKFVKNLTLETPKNDIVKNSFLYLFPERS